MEFISGINFKDNLEQKKRVNEDDGLQLTVELLDTLRVIHDQMGKAYPDLKIDSLFNQKNADGSNCLRVIDLGGLEPLENNPDAEQLKQHDVLMAGVAIFALLSGYSLIIANNDTIEPVESKIDEIKEISWGTKELLRKLLCRVPDRRVRNSRDAHALVKNLLSWKSSLPEQLVSMTNRQLIDGENSEATLDRREDAVFKANAMLGFLLEKNPENNHLYEPFVQRAENLTQATNLLTVGKALFTNQEYDYALKQFLKGKDLSRDSRLFRHWCYAVNALQPLTKERAKNASPAVEGIMEKIGGEDWQAALARIGEMEQSDPDVVLKDLRNSVELTLNIDAASNAELIEKIEEAANFYRKAYDSLSFLPDRVFIERYEVEDLKSKAEELERIIQQGKADAILNELIQQAESAVEKGQLSQAVDLIKEIIVKNRNSLHLPELVSSGIKNSLEANEIGFVERFYQLSLLIPQGTPDMLKLVQLAGIVTQLARNLDAQHYGNLVVWMEDYLNKKDIIPKSPNFFEKWLKSIAENKVFLNRGLFIERAEKIAEIYDFKELTAIFSRCKEKIDRIHQEFIQENLNQIDELLNLTSCGSPEKQVELNVGTDETDLAETIDLIRNKDKRIVLAEQIYARLKLRNVLGEKETLLKQLIETAKAQLIIEKGSANMESLVDRESEKNGIKKAWQIVQEFDRLLASETSVDQLTLLTSTRNSISDVIKQLKQRIYKYQLQFGNDDEVTGILANTSTLSDKYDLTWSKLHSASLEKVNEIKETIAQLSQKFSAGDELDGIISSLQEMEPYSAFLEDWHILREKVIRALKIHQWETENQEALSQGMFNSQLLSQIRGLQLNGIPQGLLDEY